MGLVIIIQGPDPPQDQEEAFLRGCWAPSCSGLGRLVITTVGNMSWGGSIQFFRVNIPPKFEHKLRHHKQRFGKIVTSIVLDKDENLLWSGLQWHRSCHGNAITYFTCSNFSRHWKLFPRNRSQELFPPIIAASMFATLQARWDKVFMVRKTVKNGYSLDVWPKRFWHAISAHSSFKNLFKNIVKDHGDRFSRLLERRPRIWLLWCIEALLLAVL